MTMVGGYVSVSGDLYETWDLEGIKLKKLNYFVTTHQTIPYNSNGKDVEA